MKYTSFLLHTILVVGLCLLLALAAGMGRRQERTEKCDQLVCRIVDEEERAYVDEEELTSLLKQQNAYPVGEYVHRVNLQHIEDIVRRHPMVRTAECYTTENGSVMLQVTQRVPLLKVITANESYFIDTDHLRMPIRKQINDTVLCARGRIGEQSAAGCIADFAEWLQKEPYWQTRITAVEIQDPHHVRLCQRQKGETILIGVWEGYEQKLQNAKRFYQQTQCLQTPHYATLDLRFRSQVVCVK